MVLPIYGAQFPLRRYCVGIGSGSADPSARGSEAAKFMPVVEL